MFKRKSKTHRSFEFFDAIGDILVAILYFWE